MWPGEGRGGRGGGEGGCRTGYSMEDDEDIYDKLERKETKYEYGKNRGDGIITRR